MAWLVVSGDDREAFLQGQLTNDIAALRDDSWQLAAYCSPQGKVLAVMWVWRNADAIWLGMPSALIDGIARRLRLFVLRSRVTIERSDLACIAITSLDGGSRARRVTQTKDGIVVLSGTDGVDVLIGPSPATQEKLDAQHWRALLIRAGIAQIYPATADAYLPQALGLDGAGAVSFSKGCYVGQENVARLQYKSRTRRHLAIAQTACAVNALPGDALRRADQVGGTVLDCGADGTGGVIQAVLTERMMGAPLQLDGCDEVLYFTQCYQAK